MQLDQKWFDPEEIKRHNRYLRIGRSKIPKAGLGVFAKCKIAKGKWIGTMTGPTVGSNGKHVYWATEDDDTYTLVDIKGPLRYANHSDTPNIELRSVTDIYTPRVYALRDIKKGEELCWEYDLTDEEKKAAWDDQYDTDLEWLSPWSLYQFLKDNNAQHMLLEAARFVQAARESQNESTGTS